MIKILSSINVGDTEYTIAIDESTPMFRVDEVNYMIMPPKIIKTCIYMYVREMNGVMYRPPVNLKLRLTGNLRYVPEIEHEVLGEENYFKHQLSDMRYKFTLERAGYYQLLFSDKRKNEWIELDSRIFVNSQIIHDQLDYIGFGWPPVILGKYNRVYFNVYNFIDREIESIEFSNGFIVTESGYTDQTKSIFYANIMSSPDNIPGEYEVKFNISDASVYTSNFYAKYYNGEVLLLNDMGISSVHLLSPGITNWQIGSLQNIEWSTRGFVKKIEILLYRGDTYIGKIAEGVDASLGVFSWIVGKHDGGIALLEGGYSVKILKEGDLPSIGENNTTFYIGDIVVVYPNISEQLTIGSKKTILWTSGGLSNDLKIVLYKDGVALGLIIGPIDESLGEYVWTVGDYIGGPAVAGTGYGIRIREKTTNVLDDSDETFELIV